MATRVLVVVLVLGAAWTAWLDLRVRAEFAGKRWAVPARIYARPLELYDGLSIRKEVLERELEAAGYRAASGAPERPGRYSTSGDHYQFLSRRFVFWDGEEPPRRLEFRLDGGRLAGLSSAGQAVAVARLEPAEIGRIYPAHQEDRVLVRLEDVPPVLVAALLAVEDRRFYEHRGVSPRAILRAFWANLRARDTVQGGSTLTQQLAKNFFLTNERTLWRKVNESLIALILEVRYDKDEILEAYINEVHLGQQGGHSVHGFGLGARYYFGRPLGELSLPEMALLVAVIRGASHYNPRRHPERARERRDLVIDLMAEQNLISVEVAARARAEPLGVLTRVPSAGSPHPAFVDLVGRQLRRDYRDEDLRSEGLRIFTTLDPTVQRAAEESLSGQLEALDPEGVREIEGAAVVSDPRTGAILALVGGRSPHHPGFNRALDAVRPIGSLVKPAVYLAALTRPERWTLATPLDDGPIELLAGDGRLWTPSNYDGRSHGMVPMHLALARSFNLATVHLGLGVGLEEVAATLRRLGVERQIRPYPSMLLGAVELSPLEVTRVYQSLANGGFRMPFRAIREVTDADGQPLSRYGLSVDQAASPESVFLVREALRGVMLRGTGRGAYRSLPGELSVAGKTGTTNELRDSWFAGFGADRVAVVWVGRDDNAPTGLTGASGALRVWSELMAAAPPAPLRGETPGGIEWAWVTEEGGHATDFGCPGALQLPFISGSLPPHRACGAPAPPPLPFGPSRAAHQGGGAG